MRIKFNIIMKTFDIVLNLTIISTIFSDIEINAEMLVKYRRIKNLIEINLSCFAIDVLFSWCLTFCVNCSNALIDQTKFKLNDNNIVENLFCICWFTRARFLFAIEIARNWCMKLFWFNKIWNFILIICYKLSSSCDA